MVDRVRLMQKNIDKYIQKRERNRPQEKDLSSSSKGLLSRRKQSEGGASQGNDMSMQDRTMDVIADYILDIRKRKEELLNASKDEL